LPSLLCLRWQLRQPRAYLITSHPALILAGNLARQLLAHDSHLRRRLDSESHATTVTFHYDQSNSAVQQDGFALAATQNQHGVTPCSGWLAPFHPPCSPGVLPLHMPVAGA